MNKSITEQKADLLDRYITEISKLDIEQKLPRERLLIKDHASIVHKHSFPFMDEVFSTRLYFGCCRALMGGGPELDYSKTTLLHAPHITDLAKVRGIGKDSLAEFKKVMKKYNLIEKIS